MDWKKDEETKSKNLGTIWSDVSVDTSNLSDGVKKAKEKLADSPQPVKPKRQYQRKPKPVPVATKNCSIRFSDDDVRTYTNGEEVDGLTSLELKRLKKAGLIK